MKEKDLKDNTISDFTEFYDSSAMFNFMGDFKGTYGDFGIFNVFEK